MDEAMIEAGVALRDPGRTDQPSICAAICAMACW